MKNSKIGKLAVCLAAVVCLVGLFLWWTFPVYQISFQDVSRPQELQLLKSAAESIRQTEEWNPRFAGEAQISLLNQRIRTGKEKTITELARIPSEDTSAEAKAGLEFQNCLIHELSKDSRFIKLSKLRAMPEPKCLEYLQKCVRKVVERKRNAALGRVLALDSFSQSKTTCPNPQADALQTLFWKYHLPFFPEVRWFDLWDVQSQWRKSFQKAVQTDVQPVLDWYAKVDKMRELNFHKNEGKAEFLQLVMDGDPIRERFRVWGNYSLYLCQTDGSGLTRKFNTGLRLVRVRIFTESDSSVPAKKKWTAYSAQTGEAVSLMKTEPTYGTANVAHFLHSMGIPDVLTIRLVKEEMTPDFSKILLKYELELDELPGWKSKPFELNFSSESCGMDLIRKQSEKIVQEIRPEIWKNLNQLKSFHGFQFRMESADQHGEFHGLGTLIPSEALSVSLDIYLDAECRLHSFCKLTGTENEAICREIVRTNEKELKDFEPFLRVEKLQLEGNRLAGRCVIGAEAFETSEDVIPADIPFDFWILPDGTLETQVISIQSQLASLKKREMPQFIEELPPEELKNLVTEILVRNYPVLSPSFTVSTGKSGMNGHSLWYKINAQLGDYPNLILGPNFVEKTDLLELEVTAAVEHLPETAQKQWKNRYEHPRYGEIHSEITGWTPSETELAGTIQNQIFLNRGNTPFSWNESLYNEPDGALHETRLEEIAEQMKPQFDEICDFTTQTLKTLYDTDFQLSQEFEEDWIQLRPLKFSMMARCIKPFQLPFNFEVGKVRISAKEVEFPKRYHLDSNQTYWFPVMAVTNPKFDVDFEDKRLKSSASFTPPLPGLDQRMNEEIILLPGENVEDLKVGEMELRRKEIEKYGVPMEKATPVELAENEGEMFFGDEELPPDTDNPWTRWLRMDLAGSGDLNEKAFGASGKLFLGNLDNVGLSGHIAKNHLELQANLDTRIRVKTSDDSEESDADGNQAETSNSGESSATLPLVVNGGILMTERLKQLKVLGNFQGFIGDGMGRIYSDEKNRQSVGMNVGGLCPMLGFQRIGVEGDTAVNFERYAFDGSGTVMHPFMRVLGTLQYGVKVWRQSETDAGFKLYFKWVDMNGVQHTFEEEYPNANAVDEEEVLRKMQEIEKEEKTAAQTASGTETTQFQAVGENYPDAVRKGERERDAETVDVVRDENGNVQEITMPEMNSESAQMFKGLMEPTSKEEQNSDAKEGESSEAGTEVDVAGNVRVEEVGNDVVFTYVPENRVLFRLNKWEMGLRDQKIESFPGHVLHRKNGTGCIVLLDVPEILNSKSPVFRRITCSSPTSIQKKEEIRSGKYSGSEADSWRKIQPLFPGSSLNFSEDEETFMSEINALKTAQYILMDEEDYEIQNIGRSGSICWFLERPKKEGIALWNVSKLLKRKPILAYIPESLCSGTLELESFLPQLMRPRFSNSVPEFMLLLAKQSDPEKGQNLLTLSINERVKELELQVRSQNEIQICSLRILPNHWKEEKRNAAWQWVLTQHLNGMIPIQENGMVYAFGEEGLAAAQATPSTLALLPAKRIQKEGTTAVPVMVSRDLWENWPADSERFLPSNLKSVSARQSVPFQNLVEILVLEWDSQNVSNETWQCAPMGLLVGLGESNTKKNEE